MWYEHDGSADQSIIVVRDCLNRTFGTQWIGRSIDPTGWIAWSTRSPDLSSMDLFLCWVMKDHVYKTPVDSEMDLVARIETTAGISRDMPDIFENVRWSIQRRSESCVRVSSSNFKHLL
ncbi:hypothetical protein HNY73_010026 [Argiope bruennichi]|uniref:Uncharacterized protein n=1 Tax=Argiope bruennichi TaxID=94029 RepID=A0A8T0EZP2_ARGBR|nr:hypothetical protein HNY73_010026 [Argiope bruennichi]